MRKMRMESGMMRLMKRINQKPLVLGNSESYMVILKNCKGELKTIIAVYLRF